MQKTRSEVRSRVLRVLLCELTQLKKTSAPRQGMRMERMPQGIIVASMVAVMDEVRE